MREPRLHRALKRLVLCQILQGWPAQLEARPPFVAGGRSPSAIAEALGPVQLRCPEIECSLARPPLLSTGRTPGEIYGTQLQMRGDPREATQQ